jgi:superfamily II DNA/RNA helicase
VHRIGRTARAQTKGAAITFVNNEDQYKFQRIEKLIGKIVDKVEFPAALGKGPAYEVSSSRNRGPKKDMSKPKGQKPRVQSPPAAPRPAGGLKIEKRVQ